MAATSAVSGIDDDIYAGYNDYPSIYSIKDLEQDELFQEALQTSYAKRSIFTPKAPGTAMRFGTSSGFHRGGTAAPGTGGLRPMTAVRGAGYTSSSRQAFDPLNMGSSAKGPAPPLEVPKQDTPEEKVKIAEQKIMELIETSVAAACENNSRIALERAREASSRERALIRLQEQAGLSDNHNIDLTFAVLFNLATQYTNNEMYTEAIATYQAITRNRMFSNSARLKVNMGTYCSQGFKDDVMSNILNEIIKNDDLSKLEKEFKLEAEKTILCAAKLIAPVIEDTLTAGFAWCVDAIKSSAYGPLAADLEINKAMVFLHNRETQLAIDALKAFENRETKANSSAAIVLSFIYYLQGDYEQAERCAEIARTADSYNAAAYVNLSACSIKKDELEIARELLLCALDTDAGHVQALYNLGLVYKKQHMYEESLECFWKVRNIARYDPQTLYQLGHLYQLLNDSDQAAEWYNQLLGIIPSDPGVLQKLGEMYDMAGDKQLAYQYYSDSYRFFPANFEVIDWLGSYFISMQVAEKALGYFRKAVELAPEEPRWRLLVAACLRRTGQFHKALSEYQDIHEKFPENIDCLKFLVRLCGDLGLKEAQQYAAELKRAEKAKELKDKQGSARPGSRRSNSGTSSRGGSGVSGLSDHRSSPISARKSQPNLGTPNATKIGRHSAVDNSAEPMVDPHVEMSTNYEDPVGPLPARPMTAAGRRDDDFGDEELGDDLLPE
ncbi:hypothetical protein KM043_003020 [Ampulex compressa]|nr:hypothetical protein KM043_003020 [Ampulex compressa]